jgi:hypothetical protein
VFLKGQTSQSPSFLSPFEIMYGHPFLLANLLPTDPAPLADYLSYLNLLQELLREHADQILPQPITTSVKPWVLVLPKDLRPSPLGLALIWSSSQHPLLSKLNETPQWQHLSRIKHCPPTSDSSTTAKDEHSCVLLGPKQLCLPCKLSPSSTPT